MDEQEAVAVLEDVRAARHEPAAWPQDWRACQTCWRVYQMAISTDVAPGQLVTLVTHGYRTWLRPISGTSKVSTEEASAVLAEFHEAARLSLVRR